MGTLHKLSKMKLFKRKYRVVQGTRIVNYSHTKYYKIQKKFIWFWFDVWTRTGIEMSSSSGGRSARISRQKLRFMSLDDCMNVLENFHRVKTFWRVNGSNVTKRYDVENKKTMYVNLSMIDKEYHDFDTYQMSYENETLTKLINEWKSRHKLTVIKSD